MQEILLAQARVSLITPRADPAGEHRRALLADRRASRRSKLRRLVRR